MFAKNTCGKRLRRLVDPSKISCCFGTRGSPRRVENAKVFVKELNREAKEKLEGFDGERSGVAACSCGLHCSQTELIKVLFFMDSEVARWIIEFLVRQSIDDRVLNRLIAVLPFPKDDSRLMKLLILRRIYSEVSSGSISEKILDSLEMIEEIDHNEGMKILDSMKEAYCKVAMDCVVRFLREDLDNSRAYFCSVVRVWRGRFILMKIWGDVGLVTDSMLDMSDEIEAAVWNDDVCKRLLLNVRRNDALESVRVFVKEAMEEMGHSFLEKMARKVNENDGPDVQLPNDTSIADQIEEGHGSLSDHLHQGSDILIGKNLNSDVTNVDACEKFDACTENVVNNISVNMDVDFHKELHQASDKYKLPLTPEVDKVQKALKSSTTELHVAVEDPLPDALRMAATISSVMTRNETNHMHSGENQNARGSDACNSSDDANHMKEVVTENQTVVPRSSIMLRNSSARTHEDDYVVYLPMQWDECSIESSSDGPPNRLHLRTPSNRRTSPLIKHDTERGFAGRRKKKKWSSLEEQTLLDGVKDYGRGNWTLILENYRHVFEERTAVLVLMKVIIGSYGKSDHVRRKGLKLCIVEVDFIHG
ncbi:hypothetical protein Scep_030773 [Stephania cephalantha]|uniref:Myb-like domain-containing protein n=1 Tax=Stephania cephalantha TaxID=152367 RepID=A0AAP0E4S1_9MAGN